MSLLGGLGAALDRGRAIVGEAKHLAEAKFAEARHLAESARGAARDASARRELVPFPGYPVLMNESTLAEGGFAFVHLARHAETGQLYAVKRMLAQDRDSAELARGERKLLAELPPHPHIVRLFASMARRAGRCEEHLLLLEFCSQGTLIRHCTPDAGGTLPPPMPLVRLLEAFVGVCRGVSHLHAQSPPIAHRDLKLENVLVDERGVCKLCDFGSATTRTLDCATASRQVCEGPHPTAGSRAAQLQPSRAPRASRALAASAAACAHRPACPAPQERLDEEDAISRFTTAMNRAPEMLDLHRGHTIGAKVDVWALGNLLFALAFQVHPFTADPPNLQILNGNWRVPPRATHALVITPLVEVMLVQDPARRPDVFTVTQAASVLHAEASAAGLTPAQAPPPTSHGASMGVDRDSAGGAAEAHRPQQASEGGGSAFRFEDMMRDMDGMAPAAPESALPAWSADFSAFNSAGEVGTPAAMSNAASAPTRDCGGDVPSRFGGGEVPGHPVAGVGGPGKARGAASDGGGVGDLLGMYDQAEPPAASPWPAASPYGGSLDAFAPSLDRPATQGLASLPQPPAAAPSRAAAVADETAGSGDAVFSPGATVLVIGLQARPELNGTMGTVLGRAQAPGRFNVQSVGGVVALRPANMQRQSGA